MATDINAATRWNTLPENIRQKILNNVFCVNCFNTTIVEYDIVEDDGFVVLKGKCKKCGAKVTRVVD